MPETTKLFVNNLGNDCDEKAVQTLFAEYGTITKVHVMSAARAGNSGTSSQPSCAFVVFQSRASAEAAIEALHNKAKLSGDTPIQVSLAHNGDAAPEEPSPIAKKAANPKKAAAATGAGATDVSAVQAQLAALQAQGAAADEIPNPYSQDVWANYNPYSPYGNADMSAAMAAAMFPGMGASDPAQLQQLYSNPYAQVAYWQQMGGLTGMGAGAYGMGLNTPSAAETLAAAGLAGFAYPPIATGVEQPAAGGGGRRGKKGGRQSDEGKLFIGGLPQNVQEADVRQVFSQVGAVKEVHIMQGRSESGQACAFVVYPDTYASQLAIRTLNKTPWHSAPDQPPIIVRSADKAGQRKDKKKGGKNEE